MIKFRNPHSLVSTLLAGLLALCSPAWAAKTQEEVPLTARGTELLGKYTKELAALRAEVVAALPPVDAAKKTRFLEVRAKWNGLAKANDETPPAEKKAQDEFRE
jgi:hypothetical protein